MELNMTGRPVKVLVDGNEELMIFHGFYNEMTLCEDLDGHIHKVFPGDIRFVDGKAKDIWEERFKVEPLPSLYEDLIEPGAIVYDKDKNPINVEKVERSQTVGGWFITTKITDSKGNEWYPSDIYIRSSTRN